MISSNRKIFLVVAAFFVLVLIVIFFYPKSSYQWGSGIGTTRDCGCFGFNYVSRNFIGGASEVCFGLVYDCQESNPSLPLAVNGEQSPQSSITSTSSEPVLIKKEAVNLENFEESQGGLQTFRSEKFGFEFSYPTGIRLNNENYTEAGLYLEFCSELSCFMSPDFVQVTETDVSDVSNISYNYSTLGRGPASEGRLEADKVDKEIITIAGTTGLRVSVNDDSWIWIQLIKENKLFTFLVHNWKNDNLDKIIISTFKFI